MRKILLFLLMVCFFFEGGGSGDVWFVWSGVIVGS